MLLALCYNKTMDSKVPPFAASRPTSAAPPSPERKVSFPMKLHRMLAASERQGFSHIISWSPNGREFIVHDPKAFAAIVMPQYFEQSYYKSFQRQLNLYQFQRRQEGDVRGIYFNPLFCREDPKLCLKIKRLPQPRGGGIPRSLRRTPSPDREEEDTKPSAAREHHAKRSSPSPIHASPLLSQQLPTASWTDFPAARLHPTTMTTSTIKPDPSLWLSMPPAAAAVATLRPMQRSESSSSLETIDRLPSEQGDEGVWEEDDLDNIWDD